MLYHSILKNYRNLENHKLKGIINNFETLNFKRYFILKMYPFNWKNIYKNNELKFNYCPIMQESLVVDTLLKEKYFYKNLKELFFKQLKNSKDKKNLNLLKVSTPSTLTLKSVKRYIKYKTLFLRLNNFSLDFHKNNWKKYVFYKLLNIYLIVYKKYFMFSRKFFFFRNFTKKKEKIIF